MQRFKNLNACLNRYSFSKSKISTSPFRNGTMRSMISYGWESNVIRSANCFSTMKEGFKTISNDVSRQSVTINWDDGKKKEYLYMWLRDHCPCPNCLHPVTLQRQTDTLTIPKDVKPEAINILDKNVVFDWEDKHKSVFSSDWLKTCSIPYRDSYDASKVYWGAEIGNNMPKIEYKEVLSGDEGLLKWLDLINKYGFAIVTGVPTDLKSNRELMEKISYIRENIYGSVWDFTADMSVSDTAYSNIALQVHTDGSYFKDPPGLQMFHLYHFDGVGGQTIAVDGHKVAYDLKNKYKDAYDFFTTTPLPFHYIDNRHYLYDKKTIFQLDEQSNMQRFSFNNDDRAPLDLPLEKTKQFYEYIQILLEHLRKPENELRFQMTPGNVIVYNNWRVLHGRTSFTGNRRMVGCYMNYEDFQSKRQNLHSKFKLTINPK